MQALFFAKNTDLIYSYTLLIQEIIAAFETNVFITSLQKQKNLKLSFEVKFYSRTIIRSASNNSPETSTP